MNSLQRTVATMARVWIYAVAYACTVAGLVALLALTVGIATGGGFVRGKVLLFVAGWLLMAYAIARMWPTTPEDLDDPRPSGEPSVGSGGEPTRIQAVSRELPPVRWMRPPPPGAAISRSGKLFLAALAALSASFLMETTFGIV